MIPTSIQTFVNARIAELDAAIAPLVKERDDLTAWLDSQTAPAVTQVPTVAHTPVALPVVEPVVCNRKRPESPIRLKGKGRPTRIRRNTVADEEYLFLGNGYKNIARNHNIGTPDPKGVWMTRGEWLVVRDIKSHEDARRGK